MAHFFNFPFLHVSFYFSLSLFDSFRVRKWWIEIVKPWRDVPKKSKSRIWKLNLRVSWWWQLPLISQWIWLYFVFGVPNTKLLFTVYSLKIFFSLHRIHVLLVKQAKIPFVRPSTTRTPPCCSYLNGMWKRKSKNQNQCVCSRVHTTACEWKKRNKK